MRTFANVFIRNYSSQYSKGDPATIQRISEIMFKIDSIKPNQPLQKYSEKFRKNTLIPISVKFVIKFLESLERLI